MNETLIRQIVQDEMKKNYESGAPKVPPHNHDGVTNSRINQKDVFPGNSKFNGTISMSQGTITGTTPNQVITWANYYLPCPPNPSAIFFYGGALNTSVSPTIHAMITGEARLVSGYQYQPGTTNSVIIGTINQPITQGSGAFIMTNGAGGAGAGAAAIIRNSQSYIAFASDASNNIYAVARVYSFNNSQILIQTAFASNWSLSGFWSVI